MARNITRNLLVLTALAACAITAPARADDFKADVKYVQVGDVKLAYYMRGEGKPLVMVNGFVSTMSLWDPRLIAELAKTHQLIMFDNRGVGMSTDSAENKTTIPQMADDAAGLIQALGLKQPDVLGWSMGARITQQLVIRHPDVVGKVVIMHVRDGLFDPATYYIDPEKYHPIGRMFGQLYTRTRDHFKMTVPSYEDWQKTHPK